MVEIEHIFIALASPLFVFCFVMEKEERRHLLALLAGFGAALLAGYINSYFAVLFQMTGSEAVQNLTPIVEELLKMLPVLFFAEAFAQNRKQIIWLGEPAFFRCPRPGNRGPAPVMHPGRRDWHLFAL